MYQRVLLQVKQHPIASIILLLYLAYWFLVLYMLVFNRSPDDSEAVGFILMYSFMFSAPYVITLGVLAWIRKPERGFYNELLFITLLPVTIALLTALLQVIFGSQ